MQDPAVRQGHGPYMTVVSPIWIIVKGKSGGQGLAVRILYQFH